MSTIKTSDERKEQNKMILTWTRLNPHMKDKNKNEMILTWTRLKPQIKDKNRNEIILTWTRFKTKTSDERQEHEQDDSDLDGPDSREQVGISELPKRVGSND